MKTERLNLGCGENYRVGWINCDNDKSLKLDKFVDLTKFPFPFKDNSADEIELRHVLEHLERRVETIDEIYRISKDRGLIRIIVPHWSNALTYADLTHKFPGMSAFAFRKFLRGKFNPYNKSKTSLELIKIRYRGWHTRSRLFNFISDIYSMILNISPVFTEFVICKILPVTDITFEFRAVKS